MLPQEYALGLLSSDGKGLLKAWIEGSIAIELRKINIASPEELRSRLKGECLKCRFFNSCRGRCIAQRIIYWKSMDVTPDPMCPLMGLRGKRILV